MLKENQKIRVAITGASGFIGLDLINRINLEDFEVRLITRNAEKLISFSNMGFDIVEADLRSSDSLKKAFQDIDVLINLAAEVRNQNELAETNIQGTENLIGAILHNEVKQVIHLSSVGVVGVGYSPDKNVIHEDALLHPRNEYERTKAESERLLIEAAKNNAFQLQVLRPTNVFGEGHPFNALLNLMKKIQHGKLIPSARGAYVNYVYVGDVSEAILNFTSNSSGFGIYNVGNTIELEKFYAIIAKSIGVRAKIIRIPAFIIKILNGVNFNKLQSISNKTIYADQGLTALFNYSYGIEKGIEQTVDYYRKQNML